MTHIIGDSSTLSYLAGVLHGDGWCGKSIGLHVKDRDFAFHFSVALSLATGCFAKPRKDGRYWRCTAKNGTGKFSQIKKYAPKSLADKAAWLRGLFDSEGNAQLRHKPMVGPNCYGRRVAFYSTETATLQKASAYLTELGVASVIRQQKSSASHLGIKPVYELQINQNRNNFLLFAWYVGSNIERKRAVLLAIPLSYQPDVAAFCRAAQRIGAAAKHQKLMDVTLPAVVAGVQELIRSGVKPTQRACRSIPGYASTQRWIRQPDLINMASKH